MTFYSLAFSACPFFLLVRTYAAPAAVMKIIFSGENGIASLVALARNDMVHPHPGSTVSLSLSCAASIVCVPPSGCEGVFASATPRPASSDGAEASDSPQNSADLNVITPVSESHTGSVQRSPLSWSRGSKPSHGFVTPPPSPPSVGVVAPPASTSPPSST